ncbi:hypothetical protein CBF27_09650 [Vagococcus acidifermentans]|uniref:Peptidase M13 n=1 Tax=Vagococcus acidifermentans TaxID=564710 RepID=A0A430ASB0_9ENTE|nr:hypothetical protein CBF27_09650 [Vagococcus acidifermentans]
MEGLLVKRKKFSGLMLLLLVTLGVSACEKTSQPADTTEKSSKKAETVNLKDDFYGSVNQEWLAETKIDEDKPVNAFTEISEKISDSLAKDFDKMLSGELEPSTPDVQKFLTFYEMMLDTDRRNKEGAEPVLPYLETVDKLSSLEDLSQSFGELTISNYSLPINLTVMTDMKDSEKKLLVVDTPSILLSDKSYYEEDSKEGKKERDENRETFTNLLLAVGKTKKEAATMVDNYFAFDSLIARYSQTTEEKSDFINLYNPSSFDETKAAVKGIDLSKAAQDVIGVVPDTINVVNPVYLEHINEIINEENFASMKDWMYIDMLSDASEYLSEDIANGSSKDDADKKKSSEESKAETKKAAYDTASELFADAIGQYYGQTYLGSDAKNDVIQMTENIIDEYKVKIQNSAWMSDETKKTALKKLDKITILIGYPEALPNYYNDITIDTQKSIFDNWFAFKQKQTEEVFAKYSTAGGKGEWEIPAHQVNAFYYPQNNSICFPASILQAPFYDAKRTVSQNYGGIGTVIAHELSHALDPNGAKFDENGNLKDWWTEEDYAEFEKRTNAFVKQFDGLKFAGGKVNGKQTVGENMADSSGISVSLETLKKEEDADLEEFFTALGGIWREKSTTEIKKQLLLIDNHAPSKLRTNIQLSNLDDFYETFDIQEGDKMYLPPEERLSVW